MVFTAPTSRARSPPQPALDLARVVCSGHCTGSCHGFLHDKTDIVVTIHRRTHRNAGGVLWLLALSGTSRVMYEKWPRAPCPSRHLPRDRFLPLLSPFSHAIPTVSLGVTYAV